MTRPPRRSPPPSALSVALLVATNAVPLLGVLSWGWDAFRLVLLYWLENVIVGAIHVVKLAMARPFPVGPDEAIEDVLGPGGRDAVGCFHAGSKLFLVPFFVVHYGLFTVVHGVFIFALLGGSSGLLSAPGGPFAALPTMIGRAFSGAGLWPALALALGHLYAFGRDFVMEGEWRTKAVGQLMFEPYGRIIVLHVAILFGGVAVAALGNPIPLLVLLVAGKTLSELALFRRHEKKRRA